LIESLPGLRVAGVLLEQFQKKRSRLLCVALNRVNASQVQVSLIERGSNPDALFKALYGLAAPLGSKIQDTAIVQSFRIGGTKLQGAL
jgi:hypothetical protein